MQVAANTLESQVVNHRQVAFGVEERNNASISLKTQEGDVVNLSFNNLNKYSESASKTENQDGTSVGEFSIAALSASKYSMSVQGNLNADEMAAIKKMADAITPIAQSFFSQDNGVSLEQAAQSLSESMGVIKEVEVKLELTVTQTMSETQVSRPKPENAPPPATTQTQESSGATQKKGVRNPEALANAVVDSAFQKEGNGSEQGDKILLRGLSDLMEFLKKQLKDFITQLEHSQGLVQQTPSATASAPQSATQTDDKKTADATPPGL